MIPKIIHCCWIGECPKTGLAEKCRESWRKFASGWTVWEWTLDEVRRASAAGEIAPVPKFFEDAVKAQKWAFAADWVRFAVLHAYGGLYLDYDVELLRRMEDFHGEFVAGQWMPGGGIGAEPAVVALEKGSEVAKSMVDFYADAPFDIGRTAGVILESVLARKGLKMEVLHPEVFCPIGIDGVMRASCRTIGVHRYAMSWATGRRKVARWLSWHGMRRAVDAFLVVRRAIARSSLSASRGKERGAK